MKNFEIAIKAWILVCIVLVILCVLSSVATQKEKAKQINIRYEAIEFRYKGHDYIQFERDAIVHNPECRKCLQAFD